MLWLPHLGKHYGKTEMEIGLPGGHSGLLFYVDRLTPLGYKRRALLELYKTKEYSEGEDLPGKIGTRGQVIIRTIFGNKYRFNFEISRDDGTISIPDLAIKSHGAKYRNFCLKQGRKARAVRDVKNVFSSRSFQKELKLRLDNWLIDGHLEEQFQPGVLEALRSYGGRQTIQSV